MAMDVQGDHVDERGVFIKFFTMIFGDFSDDFITDIGVCEHEHEHACATTAVQVQHMRVHVLLLDHQHYT